VPFFDNVGPSVTLAEQWNGNGPAIEAAGNYLGASPSITPGPCARAFTSMSARPTSTPFRFRPAILTARTSSQEVRALHGCGT
jgi:hypothetical protein